MLELRRAIPFLAIPVLAFALAGLVTGCGIGSSPTLVADRLAELVPAVAAHRRASRPSRRRPMRPKPTEKLDRIGRNRVRWEEAGIDSYRITLQYGCFCEFGDGRPVDVQVVDGKVVEVVADGKPDPETRAGRVSR